MHKRMENAYLCKHMKKALHILLATFYFVCASGVYVHAHFCADELSSVSYFAMQDDKDCGCGDEESGNSCCKDVLHFYKVESHQDASFVKDFHTVAIKIPLLYSSLSLFKPHAFNLNLHELKSHVPPPLLFIKVSKLIVNSVFRL